MDAILRVLMRGLDRVELLAMYLVYMRRCSAPQAGRVVGVSPDRMRTFERKLRDKLFPGLKLEEARDSVAALYEMLPPEGRDGVLRHLVGLMPPASETREVLLTFHRSKK